MNELINCYDNEEYLIKIAKELVKGNREIPQLESLRIMLKRSFDNSNLRIDNVDEYIEKIIRLGFEEES